MSWPRSSVQIGGRLNIHLLPFVRKFTVWLGDGIKNSLRCGRRPVNSLRSSVIFAHFLHIENLLLVLTREKDAGSARSRVLQNSAFGPAVRDDFCRAVLAYPSSVWSFREAINQP